VVGEVTGGDTVEFAHGGRPVVRLPLSAIERAWKRPLDLDGTLLEEVRP
jgi:hypothetical protein